MIVLCPWDVRHPVVLFEMFSTAIEWVAKKHLSIPHLIHILDGVRVKRGNGKTETEKRKSGKKGKRWKSGKAEKRVKDGKAEKRKKG